MYRGHPASEFHDPTDSHAPSNEKPKTAQPAATSTDHPISINHDAPGDGHLPDVDSYNHPDQTAIRNAEAAAKKTAIDPSQFARRTGAPQR